LTEELLKKAGKVIAIEKDERLISILQDKFAQEIQTNKLELINEDALAINASRYGLEYSKYKLIANIPYYITGEIIRKFHEEIDSPSMMVLMVQKEVAERIAKDKKESVLSISVKIYGIPEYIATVKAGSFYPAPNVDSAILKISNINKSFFTTENVSEKEFFAVIKAGFLHKRKFLARNLESIFDSNKINEVFSSIELSNKSRAEDLNLEQWKKLIPSLIH
jgi:16S rRNA (adenine1518-N6/adenine1519-N6)-dimethyltransferase